MLYALVRSRVVAEKDRLVVVNGYRRHEYDWAEIVAVHLPPGAPWATLDLADGTTVPRWASRAPTAPAPSRPYASCAR